MPREGKGDNRKRTVPVRIRLSKDEVKLVREAAEIEDRTISAMVRYATLRVSRKLVADASEPERVESVKELESRLKQMMDKLESEG